MAYNDIKSIQDLSITVVVFSIIKFHAQSHILKLTLFNFEWKSI